MKFFTLWVNARARCRDVHAAGRPSTGMSETYIKNLVKIARERGFDEAKDRRILDIYLKDRDRSGRPKKRTSAKIQ